MHELLVGYLLNEIDDDQRRIVEEKLAKDPELRKQLAALSRCMGSQNCSEGEDPEAPQNLAKRTSERVAYMADSGEYELDQFSSLGFSRDRDSADDSCNCNWTVADLTVAAGVVLAVGMLLLPALRDSRSASRRLQCQNNLKQLGFALADYSRANHRYMPTIEAGENAGIFAVKLSEGGFMDGGRIARMVVCPGSRLAEEVRARRIVIRVPSWDEFQRSQGRTRTLLEHTMAGDLAYHLPYEENGQLRMPRNTYDARMPVLSDAPRVEQADYTSRNHGGCGQNVLFQDLSVPYVIGFRNVRVGSDHLYLNYELRPRPGRHPMDSVLSRSEARVYPSATN